MEKGNKLSNEEKEQSIGIKETNETHDDYVIDQINKFALQLKLSDVRKKQSCCTIKDLKKDELPSYTKNFLPSARMNVLKFFELDKNDTSLTKYKKSLLGDIDEEEIKKNEPAEVEVIKVVIICKDRPNGDIVLNFDKNDNQKRSYVLKEESIYHLKIFFRVRYDIVSGLKFVNNIYRHSIKVDKSEEMLGSFSPKKEIQTFDLIHEMTPSGFLSRGDYHAKAMFVDHDGIVHMQYEYDFKISENWE